MLEKVLPRRLKVWAKDRLLDLAREPARADLLRGHPWVSPNVWAEVTATYRGRPGASVFEYGSGFSSFGHLRLLMAAGGGSYAAVEHDRGWWGAVCDAVLGLARAEGWHAKAEYAPPGDFVATLAGPAEARVRLSCREPLPSFRGGQEGTAAEFAAYVAAADAGAPYDLIVVDGRARVACVTHALDAGLARPGGALALYEAGRGTPNWLGGPTLTGDWDYRGAVARMRAAGGRFIDGVGAFSWPGPLQRGFGRGAKNPPVPLECCLLVLPRGH